MLRAGFRQVKAGRRVYRPGLRQRRCAVTRGAKLAILYQAKMARNLRVTKWLGPVPAVGVCSQCGREFKVPLTSLKRNIDAQESLRKQFAEHRCPGEAEARSREPQPK